MSQVATCPNCGSTSKVKEKDGVLSYQAIQNDEAFKKIEQLKKAMQKYKSKAEALENELKNLRAENE